MIKPKGQNKNKNLKFNMHSLFIYSYMYSYQNHLPSIRTQYKQKMQQGLKKKKNATRLLQH